MTAVVVLAALLMLALLLKSVTWIGVALVVVNVVVLFSLGR